MEKYKYSDITEKIIGASMKVHSYLGNGFQEVIYQRCLALELVKTRLKFLREKEMPIFYHEQQVGTRRADFVVEGKVIVEMKAVIKVEEVHWAQILNYLRAYEMEVGLLINFGRKSLEFKRFVLSK